MVDIDDKELFSSAITDEQIPDATTEAPAEPAAETPQQDERPRDEHGRFVSQQQTEEPAPQPEPEAAEQPQQAKEEAQVPSWRLKEIREERDALNQRYLDAQRQLEMLQRQMPRPEPKPAPDLYENPDGFVNHYIQQELSPFAQQQQALQAQVQAIREENSRWRAEAEHGSDAVRGGYEWLAKGIQAKDPYVVHTYNEVMRSNHPFDTMVRAFKEVELVQQIKAAGGPDKWREQHGAGQPQQGRQPSNQPQGSITKLPPSLRNTPAARGATDEGDNDTSDAALFRHAMRS